MLAEQVVDHLLAGFGAEGGALFALDVLDPALAGLDLAVEMAVLLCNVVAQGRVVSVLIKAVFTPARKYCTLSL